MEKVVVRTVTEKCVQCYACVRNCPVKAVAIRDGKAQVIQERCIQCGNCVLICSQNAKKVADGITHTLQLLDKGKVAAVIAPSFPASFGDKSYKIFSALRTLGFSQVWEAAAGAELVVQECQKLQNDIPVPAISPFCPAIVNMIEKHHPEFIPNLIPVVSPAVATARLIRKKGLADYVVFIGPCIAKKGEIHQPSVAGDIDEVITFKELVEIFQIKKINPDMMEIEPGDSPIACLAYMFPLSGSFTYNLNNGSDTVFNSSSCVVEGCRDMLEVLDSVHKGNEDIKIIDALFCNGCINGPGFFNKETGVMRKIDLMNYIRSIPIQLKTEGKRQLSGIDINLTRFYRNLHVELPQPEEEDIKNILCQTQKEKPEDLMNCGACGYSTCREKAIAVYQGIAELDMCLPYLIVRKNELINSINEELKYVRELKDDLDILIDASYDGICMTDKSGNIIRANKNLCKLLGMAEDKLLQSNMSELEEQKILYPSITMTALKEKKAVTISQHIKSGKRVLATANPVVDEKGMVTKIISNIRDFEQLQKIIDELDSVHKLPKTAPYNGGDSVVVLSEAFSRVMDMAKRVAIVDATVLILGESGVGKEVVAGCIHKHSNRAKGPFIKINCGALPESLIETELFGYETGAFTGAKSSGKPGLFEIAHGGTLFLDEIGELPLTQQVKLLQVIQDNKVTRVGGTRAKEVNVRLITATNCDLARMVRDGQFRADLFYRLYVVPIKVPPLRERRADIIPLAYHFLDGFNLKYRKKCRLTRQVREALYNYSWPGNVRELKNMIERLVVISEKENIELEDLPPYISDEPLVVRNNAINIPDGIITLKEAVEEVEKQLILRAKEIYDNTYKMAEVLGINQSTVVRKLKKYTSE